MRRTAVIGVGQTPFVKRYPGTIKELAFDAYRDALLHTCLRPGDIDAAVICSAPEYDRQRTPAGVLMEYLGLNPQPAFTVESACASGSAGLRTAYGLIAGGLHDVVLVIGYQKMSDLTSAETQERMGRGADIQWEAPFGAMMPGYYAMHAQRRFHEFGTTEDDLALVRVKASLYGGNNPHALFRKPISSEAVLASKYVSTPLRMMDCCANADGAACALLASEEKARDLCERPVWILGLGMATASVNMSGRAGFTNLDCARTAARRAYDMAGVGPRDIQVAEVHDCFTIAELMAYEDLGFAEPGQADSLLRSGETYHGGKVPTNLDGGLLAKGHPIGASGLSQIRTIVLQLRGEGGSVQVENAEVGLVHNVGGAGVYGAVTIFGTS